MSKTVDDYYTIRIKELTLKGNISTKTKNENKYPSYGHTTVILKR